MNFWFNGWVPETFSIFFSSLLIHKNLKCLETLTEFSLIIRVVHEWWHSWMSGGVYDIFNIIYGITLVTIALLIYTIRNSTWTLLLIFIIEKKN